MGLVGKEIVQSRVWIDPAAPPAPNLNYKYTYPITVFDAVKENISDNSKTLKEIIDAIYVELKNRQPIIPNKPANYLMTYAGHTGAMGAIQISQDIPWDPEKQSTDKIPTEKAVGELLMKLGIINEDGSVDESGASKVRWSDIIGRPNMYINLGNNDDGFVTQKTITEAINHIQNQINNNAEQLSIDLSTINKRITDHNNASNPHHITLGMLGGVSNESFMTHLDAKNPHNITKIDLGLDNVDNTSDMDKPISKATKDAIDTINTFIQGMSDDIGNLKFVVNIEYDKTTGALTWNYNNGDKLYLILPGPHLVDDIHYDSMTKELVVVDNDGTERRVDVTDLFIRYIGSSGNHITININGDQTTGNQIIEAVINPRSITDSELADESVISRVIKDQAVTTSKIKDLTITTIKMADGSVTTDKISDLSITNSKIADRSVDGRVLFSSSSNNKLLAVKVAGEDPIWTQATEEMIANDAIRTHHILNRAVTSDKIADKAVITARIDDQAVTNEKLSDYSVTNEKIKMGSIEGDRLVENPIFTGVIKSTNRPDTDSNTNEIPDTKWVRDNLSASILENKNFADRSVDGRVLFSSYIKNRVLTVGRALSDPEWGLINNEMMDINSVGSDNIIDRSIKTEKIEDRAINSLKLAVNAVMLEHIADKQVGLQKLWASDEANMVVASINAGESPIYTKIYKEMIAANAITTEHIEDGSVSPGKITPSEEAQRVLVTNLAGSKPIWSQISTNMLGDRVVDGRSLFTSPFNNMILAVTSAGVDPAWMKINSEMIDSAQILRHHISENSISTEHIIDGMITKEKMADGSVTREAIVDRSIDGYKLFTSEYPNRILGVGDKPFTNPTWMQINTGMIEDASITREKLFQSTNPYRVLAATQANVPPEYTMISHHFIVDGTIIPEKLQKDFVLFGNPELTVHPKDDADNFQLASTQWVRRTVANMINDFNPEILFDTVDTDMIKDHSITGKKLFTTSYAPRVLGVAAPNQDVEFLLIEEALIADGAVTTNKLQRSIHLLGSPVLEVRPAPNACDYQDGGMLIPDCQWVIDRILEYVGNNSGGNGGSTGGSSATNGDTVVISPMDKDFIESIIDGTYDPEDGEDITITEGYGGGNGGSSSSVILDGSIITQHIQDRAITGDKLFTSSTANTVLAVTDSNSDPKYIKISQAMLENERIIDGSRLFSSNIPNRVLGVKVAGGDPEYITINHDMLEEDIIDTENIIDRSITNEKIALKSITSDLLSDSVVFDEKHITDKSVTNRKIADGAVDTRTIEDNSVTSNKLSDKLELPAYTKVAPHQDLERECLRNTIISHNAPTGGSNGLIWLRYI